MNCQNKAPYELVHIKGKKNQQKVLEMLIYSPLNLLIINFFSCLIRASRKF